MSEEVKNEEVNEVTEQELREQYEELAAKDKAEEEKAEAEVVTISEVEKQTGEKVNIDPEMLKQQAMADYLFGVRFIQKNAMKLGKRALIRTFVAALQMPEGKKIPSKLKTQEEKILFAMAQKSLAGRFTLVYDQIVNNIQQERLKNIQVEATQKEESKEEEKTNG